MRKKTGRWICIAAAVCLLVSACTAGAMAASPAKSAAIGPFDTLIDLFQNGLFGSGFPREPFLAVMDIEGTITSAGGGAYSFMSNGYDQSFLLDYVDRLMYCDSNAGILLRIDSGGGEMGASDELYLKLMDYKAATGRPVYAYFGDTACSGAYYIAMAADEIWANRNSICVNIGVYIETYNLSGLFKKYGVEEIMIKSSENKGIGAVGQPWTEEQKAIYQSIVDLYYEQFLEVVADGRGMTTAQVRRLDDGREMLAAQALEAGFIDGIGRYEEYESKVLGELGIDAVYAEEPEVESMGLLGLLLDAVRPARSELELLQGLMERSGGFVVMAAR